MEILLKLTELLYLAQKWRYTLLGKHVYFPAISPILSDSITINILKMSVSTAMSVSNKGWDWVGNIEKWLVLHDYLPMQVV